MDHRERLLHQLGADVIGNRETGQLPRVAVDNGRKVYVRLVLNRQIRDITDVGGVRFLRSDAFHPVIAVFGWEHGLDPCLECGVVVDALLAGRSRFP